MALVERKKANGKLSYRVATRWRGKVYFELSGTDKREAQRLDERRKREVKAETYQPPSTKKIVLLCEFADEFLAGRKTRSIKDELRWYRKHVEPREWFSRLRLEEVNHGHVERLVAEIRAAGKLVDKSIGNLIGVLSVMFASAIRSQRYFGANPASLPRGVLNRRAKKERGTFTGVEIRLMTRHQSASWPGRVYAALLFYTGCRRGEAAGLRWGDLDTATEPLWALDVNKQYGGEPLKTTDRPRCIPVHPELQAILEAWGKEGFELYTTRKPRAEDFIVPNVSARANAAHHTRKTATTLFERTADEAGVPRRGGVHASRHTFITLCRRGAARGDRLQVITHNAQGTMVDRYTHWDWAPLCEAVMCLDLDSVAARKLPRQPAGFLVSSGVSEEPPNTQKHLETPQTLTQTQVSIPGASTHIPRQEGHFSGARQTPRQTEGGPETHLAVWALALAAESLGVRGRPFQAPEQAAE